jgi:hypothetical protein
MAPEVTHAVIDMIKLFAVGIISYSSAKLRPLLLNPGVLMYSRPVLINIYCINTIRVFQRLPAKPVLCSKYCKLLTTVTRTA